MSGNLLKCSHKKLVFPIINFDFSKKSSGQINVRFFLSPIKMSGNLLKCSHKKLVLPIINFDFSKKSSGQINVRFFFKSHKNGPKKPDIYLTGPGIV